MQDRIQARLLGVGKASGRATLGPIDPVNSGATRLQVSATGQVDVIALDDLWPDLSESVAILKIDVEGMEADVLAGAEALIQACRPCRLC